MLALIVNADDLGAGPGRDRGIFEAFERGIVTSASLLANGPSFAAAARQARELGLPVGVHLNLSEGLALTGVIAGLTDPRGRLPGKAGLRKILQDGHFDAAAVQAELTAQVDAVRTAGLHPDHLDTHQHCSLFAKLTDVILAVARSTGIGALRLPAPMEPAAADPPGELGRELTVYRQLAPACRAALQAAGLRHPDGLWGMPLLDRLDEATLAATLEQLPEGTWELMVHPGYQDPTPAFAGPARETERLALTAAAVRAVVERRKIKLCSFGDLPCAS